MKLARRFTLLTLVILCLLPTAQAKKKPKPKTIVPPCSQGTPYRGCPACGSKTKDAEHLTLNVNKNRATAVTSPQTITVQAIRDPANNTGKFTPNKQVSVTGFVATIDPGGMPETCNCKRTDLRDVHINIVASASEVGDQSKYVVVEFTPRWEKKFNFDDGNYEAMLAAVKAQIQGKFVKFDGWMLYDFIHANASQSTSPNQPVCPNDGQQHPNCNWRATPWEVHPVTAYTVVTGP
ncbi:MAG TPA: hypothetical protein VHE60_11365 [Pyrinomonadaceae bacterium]|nr:hypothetical protein [Pyrinomonadaceae bacterium]